MLIRFSDLAFPARFWENIQAGKRNQASMEVVLQNLSKDELEIFGNYFDFAVADLVQQVQIAGNSKNPTDLCDVIAGWVLSHGKDFFAEIFDNPTKFPQLRDSESDLDNVYYTDNYYGMAQTIYEDKFNQSFPIYSEAMWKQAKLPRHRNHPGG